MRGGKTREPGQATYCAAVHQIFFCFTFLAMVLLLLLHAVVVRYAFTSSQLFLLFFLFIILATKMLKKMQRRHGYKLATTTTLPNRTPFVWFGTRSALHISASSSTNLGD